MEKGWKIDTSTVRSKSLRVLLDTIKKHWRVNPAERILIGCQVPFSSFYRCCTKVGTVSIEVMKSGLDLLFDIIGEWQAILASEIMFLVLPRFTVHCSPVGVVLYKQQKHVTI